MGFNIAIDGPAGAGKSTIARRAAEELGFVYVDTGAMYRAIAVYLLQKGIPPEEKEQVEAAVKEIQVSIAYEEGEQQVLLNGENVTSWLRREEVGRMASSVSAIPAVRQALFELQRSLAEKEDVIMDGRDIGTAILPNAELKIYLTASVEMRARRRCLELSQKGEEADLAEVEKDIRERDERDMNRETAPLRQAPDAIYLDTSHMTIEEVVGKIKTLCQRRRQCEG